jgi:hypothetical protein
MFDYLFDHPDALFVATCVYDGLAMSDALAPGKPLPPGVSILGDASAAPAAGRSNPRGWLAALPAPCTAALAAALQPTGAPLLSHLAAAVAARMHGLVAGGHGPALPFAEVFRGEARLTRRWAGATAGELSRVLMALAARVSPRLLAVFTATHVPASAAAAAAASVSGPPARPMSARSQSMRQGPAFAPDEDDMVRGVVELAAAWREAAPVVWTMVDRLLARVVRATAVYVRMGSPMASDAQSVL